MESMLEQVKEGYILTVEEKSRGAFTALEAAQSGAAQYVDAGRKPSLHITDYTARAPHPVWYYDYATGGWALRA